ncbi:molybdopterin molybdotransferase MoeA [Motilimonas cestriensis]|uniref:Molybdopterin molybdenumtransferase n=1 Tax=Motilimonas cestriensis TaxID=2742685 RepID=A0ABS8W8S5_9GAMM|nr:molybdopterin molybdotransferase MoeA [Motilimonas cestriensis]MCE2595411.1 molybdopterin molybdotransferase MoeA [Motilimonas cestriensis]
MGYCDSPGLKPIADALTQMLAAVEPCCEQITQPIQSAIGFTLAQAVISPMFVPPFNNSAMDGYAFRAADLNDNTELTLVGKSFAGAPFEGEIPKGGCIRIMTGAPLPDDADSVEMQENTQVNGSFIQFQGKVRQGQNVRLRGEDITNGQIMFEAGHTLRSRDIPLLASLGIAKVNVYQPLKVAIFSTGDELTTVEKPLKTGQIYDSNRYCLNAILSKMNVEVIDFGIIADDPAQLKDTFLQANRQADVVITSGGVSVGEADYTKDILEQLGEIGFWKLAIKPGKPFAFGKLSDSVFFGLPGNPVSALVTLTQLALPTMEKMAGAKPTTALRLPAITTHGFKKDPGRTDFQRGIYQVNAAGKLEVSSTGEQGSGVFSGMSQANCFVILEQARGNVAAGETVNIEIFRDYLN